jgi:hypothetical protein
LSPPPPPYQSVNAALVMVVAWLGLLWPPMRAALCPPLLHALRQGGGLEARECAAAACFGAALCPSVGEWLWAWLMVGSGAAERLEAAHRLSLASELHTLDAAAAAAHAAREDECIVCFSELRSGEAARRLACGHTFHAPCIDAWLLPSHGAARTACPVCAQPLRPPADRYDAYERVAFMHEEAPTRTRQAYPPLGAIARVRHHLAGEAELTPTPTPNPDPSPYLNTKPKQVRRRFAEEAEDEVACGACSAHDACVLCNSGCAACRPRWLYHVRLLQGFVDVLALQVEVWARSSGMPGGAGEEGAGQRGRLPAWARLRP